MGNQIYLGAHEKPAAPLFIGVPPEPNYFVGREELMDRMVARLTESGSVAISAGGTGGIGKTTLAVMLARDPRVLARFPDGVLWGGLGKEPDVPGILARWAEALGKDVSGIVEPADRSAAVKDLIGLRSLLIVIDDAWNATATRLLRCGGPNCCHLLTTRLDSIADAFAGNACTEKILELDEEEGFRLLSKLAATVCEAHPGATRELVRTVGGLPLAIELLGAYLAGCGYFEATRTQAIRDLSEPAKRLQLARERLGGKLGEQFSLEQVIELSLEGLPHKLITAFRALGAFASKPATFRPDVATIVGEVSLEELSLLLERNLIEPAENERLAIHQVLADYARACIPVGAQERHCDTYLAVIADKSTDWRTIEADYGQIRHAWSSIRDSDTQRLVSLAEGLKSYHLIRGLWKDSLHWNQRSRLSLRRDGQRARSVEFLDAIPSLYTMMGRRKRALGIAVRVLRLKQRRYPSLKLCSTLHSIGFSYFQLGDYAPALDFLQRAYDHACGDIHRASILSDIGYVHSTRGMVDLALEHYDRALAIYESNPSPERVADTLNNIGLVYSHKGKFEQASEYFNRALEIRQHIGDNPGIIACLNNLGKTYQWRGDLDNAYDHFLRALSLCDELQLQPERGMIIYNIGLLLGRRGNTETALQWLQEGLSIAERIGDKLRCAYILREIGSAQFGVNQPQAALISFESSLRLWKDLDLKVDLAETLERLGKHQFSTQKYQDSRDSFLNAAKTWRGINETYGAAFAQYNAAVAGCMLNKYAEACTLLQDTLQLLRNLEDPATIAMVLHNLGASYKEHGDHWRGIRYLRKAVNMHQHTGNNYAELIGRIALLKTPMPWRILTFFGFRHSLRIMKLDADLTARSDAGDLRGLIARMKELTSNNPRFFGLVNYTRKNV